ncbi:metallophosphoesterase [Aquabacterium sp.]|uniref:metallophosphoesterase n=1 Tax=Aquabacterium sp. TaxID=1872578 RepID=UPI002B6D0EB7|nr:metallophosphoesterase [Aquabacterium sp.]HSW08481.1 metallophosphoesterase [Aquabacterium sp.]
MPLRLLSFLLHGLIAWRLLPAWQAWPVLQASLALLLLSSAWLMPLGLSGRNMQRSRWSRALIWGGLICLGLFSSLFVLSLLRDVALLLLAAANALLGLALPMDTLSQVSGRAVALVAALVTLWGLVNARRTARIVTVEVPIADLPPALHGFTIAQLSDVHVGPTIRRGYLEAIVQRVNSIDADLVAVTGDLVDGSVQDLASHVAPLAGLRSRHGSFFVTGNHEYYSGAAAWVAELRRLGLRVLLNEHVLLQQGPAQLLLAGVTDYGAHHFDALQRSDPVAALQGAPASAKVRVLLAHQPRSAAAAQRAGFHLQLSGHTHGGQFWPWNLFVPMQQPFTAGLHKLQQLWVYTSRGTGYWGPPKRLGAPSEITRLRLVPA